MRNTLLRELMMENVGTEEQKHAFTKTEEGEHVYRNEKKDSTFYRN